MNPDDSAGATFRLSATVLDAEGAPTGEIAMASFTDSLIQVVKTAGDAPNGETFTIDAGGQSFIYFYAVSHTGTAPTDSPLTLTSLIDDSGTPGDPSDDLDLIAINAYVGGAPSATARSMSARPGCSSTRRAWRSTPARA